MSDDDFSDNDNEIYDVINNEINLINNRLDKYDDKIDKINKHIKKINQLMKIYNKYTINKDNVNVKLTISDADTVDPDFNINSTVEVLILNSKNNFKSNYPVEKVIIDDVECEYIYNKKCYEYEYEKEIKFDNVLGFPLDIAFINNMQFELNDIGKYYIFSGYICDDNAIFKLPKEICGILVNYIDMSMFDEPNKITLILQKDIKYTLINFDVSAVNSKAIKNIVMYNGNISMFGMCITIKNVNYNGIDFVYVKKFGMYITNSTSTDIPARLFDKAVHRTEHCCYGVL